MRNLFQAGSFRLLISIFISAAFLLPGWGIANQDNQTETPAEPLEVSWISGPTTVVLGNDIAKIQLGAQYSFVNGDDARKILKTWGEPPTYSEVGMVVSNDQKQNWVIIFEYNPVGYVRDDDKDEIDADAILQSYQEGTEAANEERVKLGAPPIHITGWFEKPRYDEKTHNLLWTLLGRSDAGGDFVNYNTRLLGRGGYMSVVLVADTTTLNQYKPEVENLIANFSYIEGERYIDFVEGDKVADYGLVALLAGGAGAAAAKMGFFAVIGKFLAKMWKLLAIVIVAIGAGLKKMFFGKSDE
jgi:uncharacterized membrane-anchored protein